MPGLFSAAKTSEAKILPPKQFFLILSQTLTKYKRWMRRGCGLDILGPPMNHSKTTVKGGLVFCIAAGTLCRYPFFSCIWIFKKIFPVFILNFWSIKVSFSLYITLSFGHKHFVTHPIPTAPLFLQQSSVRRRQFWIPNENSSRSLPVGVECCVNLGSWLHTPANLLWQCVYVHTAVDERTSFVSWFRSLRKIPQNLASRRGVLLSVWHAPHFFCRLWVLAFFLKIYFCFSL